MKRAIAALSAAFLVVASTGFAGAPKVRRPDLFLKVWRPFRAAVLSGNAEAIKPLTRFPVRWETEAGEEKKTAKDIAGWFPTLLKAPSGVKPRQSIKQYVAEKEDLAGPDLDALRTGEVRLGPLVFRRFGEKWLFAAARVDGSAPAAPEASPAPREKELDPSEIERAAPTEPAAPVVEIIDEPIPSGIPSEEPPPAPAPVVKPAPPTPKAPAPKPAAAPKPPPPAAAPAPNEGFRGFWRIFRDAVLSNDLAAVQSMTKFSFETRGAEESSALKKHSARDFILLYPRLLQADPKTGPLRDSMRELIWRKQELTVNESGTADSLGEIHIGVFVFKRVKNRWAFVRATVED